MASRFPKRNYAARVKPANAARVTPAAPAAPGRAEPARHATGERPPPAARPSEAGRTLGEPRPLAAAATTAWEPQAAWYDQLHGDAGDDFYRQLILPAVLGRLAAGASDRVLDVSCGQGVLGRALAGLGVASVGVDASPTLIDAARSRASDHEQYLVGDCRTLLETLHAAAVPLPFAHAALVMALQDLDPIQPVLQACAQAIVVGGRVVIAMTHPCFRIPRRSAWGWDEDNGVQYRRLDGYLSPLAAPIRTHPGQKGGGSSSTSFHRPLSAYLNACGAAGLAVTSADELCSHRRGTKGPRYGAEDRAAKEFPLFLVLTAVRLG